MSFSTPSFFSSLLVSMSIKKVLPSPIAPPLSNTMANTLLPNEVFLSLTIDHFFISGPAAIILTLP